MGVTAYSVIISVLFYNLSLIVVFLLSRSGAIRAKHTSALLLFITFLGVVRLLTPVDFVKTYVIRSYKVLPAIEGALTTKLLGPLTLGSLLLLIWAAGIVACVLKDCIRLRRDHLAAEQLEVAENEQALRIAEEFGHDLKLKVSPDIDLPYVAGLFHPVIYLPDADLGDEQWRNIFRHETQHILAHDEWKKLFFRVIRALFWWNPLVHLSEEDINLLIELQCDERVAGKESRGEQESYLRTMLELMKLCVYGDTPVGASHMVGRQKEMQIRFEVLLAPKTRRSQRIRNIVPVITLALFFASYLVIVQPYRFPNEEDIITMQSGHEAYDFSQDVKLGENRFILFENGEYKLYVDGHFTMAIDENLLSDPAFCEIPIIGGK